MAHQSNWSEASYRMLLAIFFIVGMILSCSKEEKTPASITFINPLEEDLHGSSWAIGDSIIIVFHTEISTGRMLPIEVGLGRFPTNDQSVRKAEEIIFSDTFRTNQQEEIFTVRWKLPNTIMPSGKDNHYRLLISTNSERQPIHEFPQTMLAIHVIEENP